MALGKTELLDALAEAQGLARWAGAEIQAGRHAAQTGQLAVQRKAPGDWASALDAAIEQGLRERIASRYPKHGFWGEEGGGSAGRAGNLTWLVDPIDGSMNFLRGYPQYSVSIALLEGTEPVVGVVFDPVRGELFSAARAQGAWCDGRRLSLENKASDLSQALAATVFPKPRAAFMDEYLAELARVLRGTAGLRRAGSMALELAYLAAGRVDAFWERGMGPWDAAAGLLLVREAGGLVWAMDDREWFESAYLAASAPGVRAAWEGLLRASC